MNCAACDTMCRRFGKHRNGLQRYRCPKCGKTYTEEHDSPLGSMTVPMDKAVLALQLLVEGASIRATERITGFHRDTILRLLVHAGGKCEALMGRLIVNIPVKDVQCDEIWGFVGKKEKSKRGEEESDSTIGSAYTFVAIERRTKLVLNFTLGRRDQQTTHTFIEGLRKATANDHFQLSTDAFKGYVTAVNLRLSDRVSFGQLTKIYSASREGEQRYAPGDVVECVPVPIFGNPDPEKICTSHVERQNLTMRMQIRRLTRLTNAFSKKRENLWAALCLHFAYYNFCRVHQTLRVTPGMEAGITDHVWTIKELLSTQP